VLLDLNQLRSSCVECLVVGDTDHLAVVEVLENKLCYDPLKNLE
jgi:hypothetical protein